MRGKWWRCFLEKAALRLVEWEEQHITATPVNGRNFELDRKVSPALRQELRTALDDASGRSGRNVRGIPAGTLVKDPGVDDGGIFRLPLGDVGE